VFVTDRGRPEDQAVAARVGVLRVREAVNRRADAVQYLTNADGQVVRVVFADGSHADYGYDAAGRLATAADATGATTLTYYPNDLLQTVAYPGGKSLTFTYDAGGRRTGSVDQDGFTTRYVYDAAGRLAQLTDATGKAIATYTYNSTGLLTRQGNANGTFSTYQYDAAGRVTAVVNHKDANTVNSEGSPAKLILLANSSGGRPRG
jgi:YD repeat-containing protein